MLRHAKGNLIDLAEQGEFDVIVHGCNCFNTMGSGIAREIRIRYPQAFEADWNTEQGSILKLGNFTSCVTDMYENKFVIINAYTQYGFNVPGESADVFEYTSFKLILQKLSHLYGDCRIGFPYIGMGLAGGNQSRIVGLLENFSKEVDLKGGTVTLVEFAR